jgi:hypothetical protein
MVESSKSSYYAAIGPSNSRLICSAPPGSDKVLIRHSLFKSEILPTISANGCHLGRCDAAMFAAI